MSKTLLLSRGGVSNAELTAAVPTDPHILSITEAAIVASDPQIDAHIQAVADARVAALAAQPPWVETLAFGAGTFGAVTANTLYFYMIMVGKQLQTTKASIAVGAAAGNVAIARGIISGTTFTRTEHTGEVAVAGTNAEQALDLVLTWEPGILYAAAIGFTDAATCTVNRQVPTNGSANGIGGRAFSKPAGYASGIPASVASLVKSTDRAIELVFW